MSIAELQAQNLRCVLLHNMQCHPLDLLTSIQRKSLDALTTRYLKSWFEKDTKSWKGRYKNEQAYIVEYHDRKDLATGFITKP